MILDEIIAHKYTEIEQRRSLVSFEDVEHRARDASAARKPGFTSPISVIAEVKRRSPSRGAFVETLDPVEQALLYERGGASAISVLTDDRYFGGSLQDLTAVRSAVSLPVLCKDFVLTDYQVFEARASGADLLLLIVAAIDDKTLVGLQSLARDLGMTPLIEVHTQHDLARALAADAELIGINNRDLADFSVNLVTTQYLAPLVPDECTVVSESGIVTRDDVLRVTAAGASVVLVGETLMRAGDPVAVIQELLG